MKQLALRKREIDSQHRSYLIKVINPEMWVRFPKVLKTKRYTTLIHYTLPVLPKNILRYCFCIFSIDF